MTFPLKNRVQNNISKVCYLQPNEKLQKRINCKYLEHNSCFRTYPKHLLTNRLAAVQLPPLCKTIEKMAEGSNKNENYLFPSSFLPSFLSVLSVEHPSSGWCFTNETVSYLETDLLFCLKGTNSLHPQNWNCRTMFMPHEKQYWNKLNKVRKINK